VSSSPATQLPVPAPPCASAEPGASASGQSRRPSWVKYTATEQASPCTLASAPSSHPSRCLLGCYRVVARSHIAPPRQLKLHTTREPAARAFPRISRQVPPAGVLVCTTKLSLVQVVAQSRGTRREGTCRQPSQQQHGSLGRTAPGVRHAAQSLCRSAGTSCVVHLPCKTPVRLCRPSGAAARRASTRQLPPCTYARM